MRLPSWRVDYLIESANPGKAQRRRTRSAATTFRAATCSRRRSHPRPASGLVFDRFRHRRRTTASPGRHVPPISNRTLPGCSSGQRMTVKGILRLIRISDEAPRAELSFRDSTGRHPCFVRLGLVAAVDQAGCLGRWIHRPVDLPTLMVVLADLRVKAPVSAVPCSKMCRASARIIAAFSGRRTTYSWGHVAA